MLFVLPNPAPAPPGFQFQKLAPAGCEEVKSGVSLYAVIDKHFDTSNHCIAVCFDSI